MSSDRPVWRTTTPKSVDDELAQHLEMLTRKFLADGLDEPSARAKATERFGELARVRNECHELASHMEHQMRRSEYFDDVKQDTAYAFRMLRRAPVFTAIAILTLALGIGANTAIFSVVRSVLLRPLPYPDADQLVQLWTDHRALGRAQPEWLTPPEFQDWSTQNSTFSGMATYRGGGSVLTDPGDPESVTGFLVSGNFFDVVGVTAARGRLLTTADDDAAAEPVVVISDALWRRRFGADASILGRRLTLGGNPWTVVGVLPKSFRPPLPAPADIYRAMRRPANSTCGRGCFVLRGIGRMKRGVTIEQARADIGAIASRLAQEYPETNGKVGAWLIPLHEQISGPSEAPLYALAGAVALVLLIACVNIANLLLVRGAARARELGVRAALGAGSARIARQLLTENAVLAVVGGTLGLALGVVGSRALAVLVPANISAVQEIRADGMVLAFTAAITIAAGALFGLVPAMRAARANAHTWLRSGMRDAGFRGRGLRGGLVVAQLSLAVVLLVGAGLLLRSFLLMQRVDLGYRTKGVFLAAVVFPPARYQGPDALRVAVNGLLEKLRANPAIKVAEVTDLPPLSGGGDQDMTAIPLGEPARADNPPSIWYRSVTSGYLATMRMRVVAGRDFTAADRDGAVRVGIINEDAAKKFWRGADPIGRELARGTSSDAPRITVIGVVASARHDGPNEPYKPELFFPFEQRPIAAVSVIIEPTRDAASATAALRSALNATDPLVPMPALTEMESIAGSAVALPRLYATLVGIFACAALLLAVLGVYGVMAYGVSQRQREIGVRLALGAAPSSIMGMVLGEGGRLVALGVGIGLVAALVLGRGLHALLFGVSAFDVPTFAVVASLLAVMTLVAAWIPARRAMRVDPLAAIRDE